MKLLALTKVSAYVLMLPKQITEGPMADQAIEHMNRERFFASLKGLPTADLGAIQTMYWLAKDAHRVQERDGGGRYFEHPRGVASILIELGYRERKYVVPALGHDLIEDTFVPLDVIAQLFGSEDYKAMTLLSKKFPVFDPLTGKMLGRYRKPDDEYYRDIAEGPRPVQLGKSADSLYNMRSLEPWEPERRVAYARKIKKRVLPIAESADTRIATMLAAEIKQVLDKHA